MKTQMLLGATVLLLNCLWTGCSPDNPLNRQGASGTVTLNGKPVQGSILFTPNAGQGTIGGGNIKDGHYSVATQKGLAPGEYSVSIHVPDPNWDPKETPSPQEVAPADYVRGEHKVTVADGGANQFDFEMTGP